MTHVLIRHKIEDFEKWKAGFEAAAEFRKAGGEKSGQIFRNAENQDEMFVVLEWESLEKAKEFMNSNELREKMKEAGVLDKPDIWFVNKEFDV